MYQRTGGERGGEEGRRNQRVVYSFGMIAIPISVVLEIVRYYDRTNCGAN